MLHSPSVSLQALVKKRHGKINILEAMVLLTTAWDRVSSETVVNYFRKSDISLDS